MGGMARHVEGAAQVMRELALWAILVAVVVAVVAAYL